MQKVSFTAEIPIQVSIRKQDSGIILSWIYFVTDTDLRVGSNTDIKYLHHQTFYVH